MKVRWLLILVILMIASCAGNTPASLQENLSLLNLKPKQATAAALTSMPSTTPPVGGAATATGTPIVHATATPVPPTATPTVELCMETTGNVTHFEISALGFSELLPFYLYLPPCYNPLQAEAYPVVYLLHGQTYTDEQWVSLGVAEEMDRQISAGEMPPFVVVMPYETPVFYNQFDVALTRSLLPWVEENYHVCSTPDCRAIGGISRGGGWALYTVFQHPGVFGMLGLHSTPSFDGEQGPHSSALSRMRAAEIPRIWMDIGLSDYWYPYALDLHEFFNLNGVAHEWIENTGKHDDAYWAGQLPIYVHWYGAGFE